MFEELNPEEINVLLTAIELENLHDRYPTTKEVLEQEGYDVADKTKEFLDKQFIVNEETRMWLLQQGYLELNPKHLH